MWTILIIAFIQMPGLALTPGINQIRTTAFPSLSLGLVQTALASASLTQPLAAFGSAMLINRRIVTKKAVLVFCLCLLAANGALALLFNTEFWHLFMLSVVLGISTGCLISNMFGLLFDNFDPAERQWIAGYQSAVINAGGIVMSLVGGLLATFMWYGGYLVLFVGLPAAALVMYTVPNYKVPAADSGSSPAANRGNSPAADSRAGKPSRKLNPKIYYYCVIAGLFMMTYSVCGANLSTHIAGIGDSATAGIAIAFMMGGGVVSGILFDKLSKKAGDYSISFAFTTIFIGYMMLSFSAASLVLVFISVFIVGMSLSIMLPRCIFMVSTLADDPSTSQTATALVSTVAPSTGAFISPIIITNLTTALFGESTSARYRFVSILVLAFALIVAFLTMRGKEKRQMIEG